MIIIILILTIKIIIIIISKDNGFKLQSDNVKYFKFIFAICSNVIWHQNTSYTFCTI